MDLCLEITHNDFAIMNKLLDTFLLILSTKNGLKNRALPEKKIVTNITRNEKCGVGVKADCHKKDLSL